MAPRKKKAAPADGWLASTVNDAVRRSLADDDHDEAGNIRPEVQARVDEEQRQFMAERQKQRDAEEKAERENYKGKLERAEKRRAQRASLEDAVKALTQIVADHEARLKAGGH